MKTTKRNMTNSIAKRLSLFLVLTTLLTIIPFQDSMAGGGGNSDYYTKVTLSKTGEGKVYAQKDVTTGSWTENEATSAKDSQSSAPTHTWYIKAEPADGWAFSSWGNFSGWSNDPASNSIQTYGTITGNTSANNAQGKATATFVPVEVNDVIPDAKVFAPTIVQSSYTGYEQTFTFTTKYADEMADFTTDNVVLTSDDGNSGTFSIIGIPAYSDNAVTATVRFQGADKYAAAGGSRSNTATLTLTSKGDANSTQSVTLTANYPDVELSGSDVEVLTDYNAAAKSGTATISVRYADDAGDFTASPASISLSNVSGVGGAWSLGSITMSETDYSTGYATISIPYTFTPTGGGVTGTVTAQYSITANAAAGGATKTITFTATVSKPETNEASVKIGDGDPVKYKYLLGEGGALEAAHAASNATITLLKDIVVTEPVVFTKTMTLDLNSYKITANLTSTFTKVVEVNGAGAVVTLRTSVSGGQIIASGDYAGRLSVVEITAGQMILEGGDLQVNNANIGLSESKFYSTGVYLASGTGLQMSGGSIAATRDGASGSYCYGVYCADGSAVDISGGSISASFPNGSYAYGIRLSGSAPLANVNVTASAKSCAYAVSVADDSEIVVESGTYTATATQDQARAFVCKGEVSLLGGTYTATAGTNTGVAITTDGAALTIGTGSFTAYAATSAYAVEAQISGDVVKINGGTFTANATSNDAAGVIVNDGASLITSAGTFTATSAGTVADCKAYGVRVAVGGSANLKSSTFKGILSAASTITASSDQSKPYGAYGVLAEGTFSANGCSFVGTAAKQYAYGVYTTKSATLTNSSFTASTTAADHASAAYINGTGITVTSSGSVFSAVAGTAYANGAYILNGALSDEGSSFTAETKQTGVAAAENSYSRGIYNASGTTLTLVGSSLSALGSTSYSKAAYALFTKGTAMLTDVTADASEVNTGHALYANGAGANLTVNSGRYKGKTASLNVSSPGAITLQGGFYTHNTNLASYLPDGYKVFTLPSGGAEYNAGYRYSIGTESNPGFSICKNVQRNKGYNTLAEALQEVTNGQVIVMTADYVLPAGEYTLPAGATLLIPYKEDQTVALKTGSTNDCAITYTTPSLFRTLTLASGAHLVVNGIFEIGAQIHVDGQWADEGSTTGPYGLLRINEGANIDIENKGELYVWGYSVGEGLITVKKGGISQEPFQIGDWPGGSNASTMNGKKKAFPVTHYFYQNIENRIKYLPGAKALGVSGTRMKVITDQTYYIKDIALVGGKNSGAMFLMDEEDTRPETWVMKHYHADLDQTEWICNSGASLGSLNINASVTTLESSNFDLPITSNMKVTLNYGEMEITQNVNFLPGSVLHVKKEGTVFGKGIKVGFFKYSDYKGGFYGARYSPTWSTNNPRGTLSSAVLTLKAAYQKDAELFLQGTYEVRPNGNTKGQLVTTTGGSNIHSTNEDAGRIRFLNAAQGNTTIYYVGDGAKSSDATKTQSVYPAQLQNADGTYANTAGTGANELWGYKNDKWVRMTDNDCLYEELDAEGNETGVINAYPSSFLEVEENTDPADNAYHGVSEPDHYVINTDAATTGNCVWWDAEPHTENGTNYYIITNESSDNYGMYCAWDDGDGYWKPVNYRVRWYNGATLIGYNNLGRGTRPKFTNRVYNTQNKIVSVSNPEKTAGTYVNYYWDGWLTEANKSHETDIEPADKTWKVLGNDEMPRLVAATDYYAHFRVEPKQYYIRFCDESGNILQQGLQDAATPEVPGTGLRPVFNGTTPSKSSTVAKEYVFDGWCTAVNNGGTFYAIGSLPVLTAAATYYAHFTERDRQYTITFTNYNGDVLQTGSVAYGTTPTAPSGANAPTRANDAFWSYDFTGWSPDIRAVDGDETYTAVFSKTALVPKYKIRFLNWDGEQLYRAYVEEGQTPVYSGVTPTREETGYTYTFTGWSPAITAASADKDYTAQFSRVAEQYYITFLDEDGAQRERKLVDYGSVPTYTGSALTKEATDEEVFEFDHWTPALASVTGEATYTAVYAASPRAYTVTFWNYNQTVKLQETEVTYGSTPSYSGGEPTRPKDTYSYEFDRWRPAIGAVKGNQEYVPAFTQTPLGQTIIFKNHDGSEVLWQKDIPTSYATVYNGPTPTRASTASTSYTFDGWATSAGGDKVDPLPDVSGPATYFALFTSSTRQYAVTFDSNGHGDAPDAQNVDYNGKATTPSPAPSETGYTFGGWYKEAGCTNAWTFASDAVTADVTLYAKWTINSHTLTWDANGGELSGTYTSGSTVYGTAVTAPTVTREGYIFNGWNTTPASTMPDNDVTYTAQWLAIVASVTSAGKTTYYANLPAAFTAANGMSVATIKLLKDVSGISASGCELNYTKASGNCTLDLNNHTLAGSVKNASDPKMLYVNATGAVFTITDNSVAKGGRIEMIRDGGRGRYFNIRVGKGTLVVAAGTVYAWNKKTWSSSEDNSQTFGADAIHLDNGATLQVTGGWIESKAFCSARTIHAESAANITISGGTIVATSTVTTASECPISGEATGLYVNGGTTTISDGEFSSTTSKTAAYNIYATSASQTISVIGGKYKATGGTTHVNVNNATSASNMSISGGYYSHNTNLATYCGSYHVVATTAADKAIVGSDYNYKVGEAYTVTWKNGAAVLKTDEDQIVGTVPVYDGADPTKAEDLQNTYTFDGWALSDNGDKLLSLLPVSADVTYYAHFNAVSKEKGAMLDVVDWADDLSTVSLNMNGYQSAASGANWKIYADGKTYAKGNREADRTLKVDISGLTPAADGKVVIEARDNSNNVESYHAYRVPHIFTADATLSEQPGDYSSILWVKSGTLTINTDIILAAIYVDSEAKLVINTGKTLTITDKIVLRTTAWQAGELKNNGTLNMSEDANFYYSRIVKDKTSFYQFALPFDADIDDVRLSSDVAKGYSEPMSMPYGNWLLRSYNAARRAQEGTSNDNWVDVSKDATDEIKANTGYAFWSNSNYYREYYFPVSYEKKSPFSTVAVTAYTGNAANSNPSNGGWNFIALPYTDTYVAQYAGDPAERIKISELLDDNTNYWQHIVTELKPAQPFYYQASQSGYLHFGTNFRFNVSAELNNVAAKRQAEAQHAEEQPTRTQWLQLTVQEDKTEQGAKDETNIFLSSRFSTAYESGYDVEKMSVSGSVPQVWTSIERCGSLAFAALPDDVRIIPLGLSTPNDGALRLSLVQNDWLDRLEHVWLFDAEQGYLADLLSDGFTLSASQGTTLRYSLVPEFKQTTGEENGGNGSEVTTSMSDLTDGYVLSVKIGGDGVIVLSGAPAGTAVRLYDAAGRLLASAKAQSADAADSEVSFTVPAAGVYLIYAGDKVLRVAVPK